MHDANYLACADFDICPDRSIWPEGASRTMDEGAHDAFRAT